MRSFVLFLFAFLILTASAADTPKSTSAKKPPTQLYIAAGTLISGSGAPIQVHSLHAMLQHAASPSVEQKQNEGQKQNGPSVVTITSGTAFLSNSSLGTLLNSKLDQRGLQDIKVSNDKGQVKITGKDKKAVSVPFTIGGPISLMPQGSIRLQTKKVQVAHIPGLADLLGVDPKKMTGDGSVKGVQASKDAIIFDPDLLWGLPVHGRVTRLTFERNGLLLVFGEAKRPVRTRGTTAAVTHGKK